MALAINGLGLLQFYTTLLERLGIDITPDVQHYISQRSNDQDKHIEKTKQAESKRKRVKACHERLLVKTVIAKRERALREGSCESLRRLDGVYTAAELAIAQKLWPGRKRKSHGSNNNNNKPKKKKEDMACRTCHRRGHGMVTSKACKHHLEWKAWRATKPKRGATFIPTAADPAEGSDNDDDDNIANIELDNTPEQQLQRDTEECERLDCLELDGNDGDLDCFFDAMEFSDSEY